MGRPHPIWPLAAPWRPTRRPHELLTICQQIGVWTFCPLDFVLHLDPHLIRAGIGKRGAQPGRRRSFCHEHRVESCGRKWSPEQGGPPQVPGNGRVVGHEGEHLYSIVLEDRRHRERTGANVGWFCWIGVPLLARGLARSVGPGLSAGPSARPR